MEDKVLTLKHLQIIWSKILELLGTKQETLVSGTNIKTINESSLLGAGNVTVVGGDTDMEIASDSEVLAIINRTN